MSGNYSDIVIKANDLLNKTRKDFEKTLKVYQGAFFSAALLLEAWLTWKGIEHESIIEHMAFVSSSSASAASSSMSAELRK